MTHNPEFESKRKVLLRWFHTQAKMYRNGSASGPWDSQAAEKMLLGFASQTLELCQKILEGDLDSAKIPANNTRWIIRCTNETRPFSNLRLCMELQKPMLK
jgi:hypothetical protein